MSKVKIIKENSETGGGMVYCLGLLGALVYFWQQADTFWEYVLAIFQAIIWPALLVYRVLQHFNM